MPNVFINFHYLLEELQCPFDELHNVDNDAYFTLRGLIYLRCKTFQMRSSPKMIIKIDWQYWTQLYKPSYLDEPFSVTKKGERAELKAMKLATSKPQSEMKE